MDCCSQEGKSKTEEKVREFLRDAIRSAKLAYSDQVTSAKIGAAATLRKAGFDYDEILAILDEEVEK